MKPFAIFPILNQIILKSFTSFKTEFTNCSAKFTLLFMNVGDTTEATN